jgi:hypothetical protein
MKNAKILREHARNALQMAETACEEDRKCLTAIAHNWIKAAKRLEEQFGEPTTSAKSQPLPSAKG